MSPKTLQSNRWGIIILSKVGYVKHAQTFDQFIQI